MYTKKGGSGLCSVYLQVQSVSNERGEMELIIWQNNHCSVECHHCNLWCNGLWPVKSEMHTVKMHLFGICGTEEERRRKRRKGRILGKFEK